MSETAQLGLFDDDAAEEMAGADVACVDAKPDAHPDPGRDARADVRRDAGRDARPAARRTSGGALPLGAQVEPAVLGTELLDLAARLDRRWAGRLHLGTSSWHFPGWSGLVRRRPYPPATLSREGLAAYSRHPLLRCVSLDRSFYRPLDEAAAPRSSATT